MPFIISMLCHVLVVSMAALESAFLFVRYLGCVLIIGTIGFSECSC